MAVVLIVRLYCQYKFVLYCIFASIEKSALLHYNFYCLCTVALALQYHGSSNPIYHLHVHLYFDSKNDLQVHSVWIMVLSCMQMWWSTPTRNSITSSKPVTALTGELWARALYILSLCLGKILTQCLFFFLSCSVYMLYVSQFFYMPQNFDFVPLIIIYFFLQQYFVLV